MQRNFASGFGVVREREDAVRQTGQHTNRPSIETVIARYESDPDHERKCAQEHHPDWEEGIVSAFRATGGHGTYNDIVNALRGTTYEMSTTHVKQFLSGLVSGKYEIEGYLASRKSMGGLRTADRMWVYFLERS